MDPSQMTPEQMAAAAKQQCIFCHIASGRVASKKVYEDDKVIAVLDINPANPGHILLITKEHYVVMPQIPDDVVAHIGMVAKALSHALLRALKAQGTTIFVANGVTAGQRAQHFMLHIIPRIEGDGIGIDYQEHSISDADYKKILDALRKGVEKSLGPVEEEPEEIEKKEEEKEEEEQEEKDEEAVEEEKEEEEKPEEVEEEPETEEEESKVVEAEEVEEEGDEEETEEDEEEKEEDGDKEGDEEEEEPEEDEEEKEEEEGLELDALVDAAKTAKPKKAKKEEEPEDEEEKDEEPEEEEDEETEEEPEEEEGDEEEVDEEREKLDKISNLLT